MYWLIPRPHTGSVSTWHNPCSNPPSVTGTDITNQSRPSPCEPASEASVQPHHSTQDGTPSSRNPPCFNPRYAPVPCTYSCHACDMLYRDFLFACLRPSYTEDCFGLSKVQPSAWNLVYIEKMNATPRGWQVGRCLGMGSGYGTTSQKAMFPVSGSCRRSCGAGLPAQCPPQGKPDTSE